MVILVFFFFHMGYIENAGVITVNLMRGSSYAYNGSCYHVLSGTSKEQAYSNSALVRRPVPLSVQLGTT